MNNDSFEVTFADISSYDWEATLVGAEPPVCRTYATKLFQKAERLGQIGDQRGEKVFRFLGAVASMALRPVNEEPFAPSVVWHNRRSSSLGDFNQDDLDLLARLLPITHEAAMVARIGDILWVTRKDHEAAKIAADNYLRAFQKLDVVNHWVWGHEMLRRGFQLARLLGTQNDPFPAYVAYVEALIDGNEGTAEDPLCLRLMELLLEHGVGDSMHHAAVAEKIAVNIESGGNYLLAQRYLEVAARFYSANGSDEAARQARLKKGRCLVRQARDVVNRLGQGHITATHFLAMGIECLRQAKAPATEVAELHGLLRQWQELSLKQLETSGWEMDIGKLVSAARGHVRGKSLSDAILAFALGHPLVRRGALRERVISHAGEFPLSHSVAAAFMSHDGRVLARKPPVLTCEGSQQECAIEAEMFAEASKIDWPLRVSAYINPGRLQILQEHRPSLQELEFLVEHNRFIPPGHEALFLRGLHAGLHGDMIVCAHVLIVQVEEAIRHVLRCAGVVTSKLDSKLVQEERLLGTLLAMPETTAILGEDCIFELRGILCERFGFDLRNRLAHGFLSIRECFGADVFLLWWLVMRFCAFPVWTALKKQSLSSETGAAETASDAPPPATTS